jgi:hypothetical protein
VGSRGPRAEAAIPPAPNAPVIAHRQRASSDDDGTAVLLPGKTFQWKVS